METMAEHDALSWYATHYSATSALDIACAQGMAHAEGLHEGTHEVTLPVSTGGCPACALRAKRRRSEQASDDR